MIDASALIGQAQTAYSAGLQNRAATAAGGANQKNVREAAESFESFFVGQMMEYMWQGVEVDPNFGGGHAEEMWRSMLNQEYGKHIVKSGGLGIANQVMASMLKAQEERSMSEQKFAALDGPADPESDNATAGAAATASLRREAGVTS